MSRKFGAKACCKRIAIAGTTGLQNLQQDCKWNRRVVTEMVIFNISNVLKE